MKLLYSISQHDSVLKDGGGCLYPVIQHISSASILQGLKAANRTGEEKVQTTCQTALTILPREHAQERYKCPRHFAGSISMGLTSAMSTSRVSLIRFRVPSSLPLTSCTHSEGPGTIYGMHKEYSHM